MGHPIRSAAMDDPRERRGSPATPPLEALLASLQDGFEVLDADGAIVEVNDRFAQIVGRPRQEIIGLRPPFPWWSEAETPRIQEALRTVLAGGSGEFDFTFQRPDGERVDVILNATSVREAGRTSVVATVKDVSERAMVHSDREDLVRTLSNEREQLGRVLERMARIQRFTASIASQTTEAQIVDTLLYAAKDAVQASGGAVSLLSNEGELVVAASHGDPDPTMVPSSMPTDDEGDLAEAFRSNASRWLDPRPGPDGPDERWGFVPLVGQGGPLGVLAVCCPESSFTFEDRDTLETMVHQATQVLERARLYAAESRTRVTLARVLAVSDAALEWMESDDSLQELLRRIREGVHADSASLLVRENDHLRVRATDGLERILSEQPLVPIGHGFAGRIAASKHSIVAEDLSQLDVVSPWLRAKLRSVAGVPIIRTSGVIGVLHVGSVNARHFDREDLDLLNLVAARVGGALERTQLYEAARAARADASRSADRLRRLQAATATLTAAMSVQDVSESILREAIGAMHADAGVLAVRSEDGRWLDVVSRRGRRQSTTGTVVDRFAVDDAVSLCEAYRSGRPVWVPTRAEWERRFPQGIGYDKPWARSILAVPLLIDDERLGAIGLLFRTEGRLERDERRLAKTFAEQAALALQRARLFEDEHAARETTERLQAFASALAAVSTIEEILTILVEDGRELLGARSAWTALLDAGARELHAVAAGGDDPAVRERLDRLPLSASLPACDAARQQREIWFDSRAELEHAYPALRRPEDPHDGAIGCLPMFDAARNVIGVVSFRLDRLDARRRSAVRAVVALAAQSVERAQLYELEHTVAATLQESLLPRSLPREQHVTVATRYLPGSQELDVGGDWYDVVHVTDDRIGVAIGDVVGHGLDAASAMGQLRSALRSLALMGEGPAAVIQGLDRFARSTSPATVATAVYAEIDLATNQVRYACAGHPPPVVVVDHRVRELMDGRTTPLAALPDVPSTIEGVDVFPPGSVLLLYSDGLIERRGEPLDVGMERLRSLLAALPYDDPETLADLLLQELAGDIPQDDDIALLCLRSEDTPGSLTTSLPADPAALAELRTELRAWLSTQDIPAETYDDLILACDEACSNAIEHAFGTGPSNPIRVDLRREDGDVVIAVTDAGTWRSGPVSADRGRGIETMRAVMDDVDIRSDDTGTVVTLRRRLGNGNPTYTRQAEPGREARVDG
jgi:PAS domain S-box-containing protein